MDILFFSLQDKPDQCLSLTLFVERNSLNFNELSCRMELRFRETLFDEESKKPATLRCQSAEELRWVLVMCLSFFVKISSEVVLWKFKRFFPWGKLNIYLDVC